MISTGVDVVLTYPNGDVEHYERVVVEHTVTVQTGKPSDEEHKANKKQYPALGLKSTEVPVDYKTLVLPISKKVK